MRREMNSVSRKALAALAVALFLTGNALGDDGGLTGRIELTARGVANTADSYDAFLVQQSYFDVFGNARLMWEPYFGDFDFTLHYKVSAQAGQSVDLAKQTAALSPAVPPPTPF